MVEVNRIELLPSGCKPDVLPLDYTPKTIVGNIGFEPMTLRLSIGCSTTEPIAHTIKKMKKRCVSLTN